MSYCINDFLPWSSPDSYLGVIKVCWQNQHPQSVTPVGRGREGRGGDIIRSAYEITMRTFRDWTDWREAQGRRRRYPIQFPLLELPAKPAIFPKQKSVGLRATLEGGGEEGVLLERWLSSCWIAAWCPLLRCCGPLYSCPCPYLLCYCPERGAISIVPIHARWFIRATVKKESSWPQK